MLATCCPCHDGGVGDRIIADHSVIQSDGWSTACMHDVMEKYGHNQRLMIVCPNVLGI